jgi:hypothetical protein
MTNDPLLEALGDTPGSDVCGCTRAMLIPETYRYRSVEHGTERPCEVARIKQKDGNVTLAFRYTDEDGEWFPTWTGPIDSAVKVPRGWRFTQEWLDIIEAAPYREELAA